MRLPLLHLRTGGLSILHSGGLASQKVRDNTLVESIRDGVGRTVIHRARGVYGELKHDIFSADSPYARFQEEGVMIETPSRAQGYGVVAVREDA